MEECWGTLEEFPNYSVSDKGNVRNESKGTLLHPNYVQDLTPTVSLYRDGKQHRRAVANLVAITFLPTPEREDFNTIIYLDGDRTNTSVTNLAWRPRHFAIKYHRERFLDPFPNWRRRFRMVETNEIYDHPAECAVKYGLLEGGIYLALVNRTQVFPGGYTFEFV